MNGLKETDNNLFPTFNAEIKYIDQYGVDGKIIKRIIEKSKAKHDHQKNLYERYKVTEKGVPIFSRKFEDENAINEKVNNDYFGEIVTIKQGYFAGEPFSYTYSQDADNAENCMEVMKDFCVRNNIADKDNEITKFAEICGDVKRLMYIDKEGNERIKIIMPYEGIVLSKTDITEPEYGIYYIDSEEIDKNFEITKCQKIEFYDDKNTYFFKTDTDGEIVEDQDEKGRHIAPHLFDYCPLQGIPNNKECIAGPEKVLATIDAIDRVVSDCNSEVEAFKLAYMIITGAKIDDETLAEAKRTGAFNIPGGAGKEVKIEYLIKAINDTFIQNHLDKLDKNVYKFSQTPDMSNAAFSGVTSGIAMKFQLFPLETRCVAFERKLDSANRYMFKVLASAWKKKAIEFDYLEAVVTYKRSFPIDLDYEAEVQNKLNGVVSEQTRLSLASFVDDPEYEITLMEQEKSSIEPLDFLGGELNDLGGTGEEVTETNGAENQNFGETT